MKAWTPEDAQTRLLELAHSGGPHAKLRRRIVEIATEHFVRFGYRKANIGEIARAVGIGKGSVYLHFESKPTLLIAAIAAEKLPLIPKLEAVYVLPKAEQLEAYLRLSLDFVLTAPLTSRVLRGDPEIERVFTSLQSQYAEDRSRGIATIASFIAQSAPGLDAALREELGAMLASLLALPAYPETFDHAPLSTERFAELYSRVLARGITALAVR